MNITQLEVFLSLSGTLNFMQTAEQLGLTQPAVSKQIKSLEQELGAKLFDRTSRSVTLTPIGQQFVPEASDMLSIYYRSKEWISSYYINQHNSLGIGYSDPHAMQIIGNILSMVFSEGSFSNLTPQFTIDQTDANLSRLQKGQLDIVIGIRDAKFDDSNIIFTKLSSSGFKCAVSKHHPIAMQYINSKKPREISSGDLMAYRQILAIPPYLLKTFFSRGHKLLPVNEDVSNIICNNTNEAYGLILSGIGYSMVPDYLIIDHPDILFLDWNETPHARFGIYHKKEYNEKTPLHSFIKNAKELYKSINYAN